jgi:protein-S-isoprenylcysteine O-methyltransferase Ste14
MHEMTSLPNLGPRGEGWVAIQGVLLVIVAAAGWSLGPDWTGAVRYLGIFVGIMAIAGGVILVVRGFIDLGRSLTPLPRPKDDAVLVDTGIYALARHPIYGGLILGSLGWSLVQASLVAVVATGVLAAFFVLKSAREEAWLQARFDGYAAYRRRTKRFIPWIG